MSLLRAMSSARRSSHEPGALICGCSIKGPLLESAVASVGNQAPQESHVLYVLGVVVTLWRLKHLGQMRQVGIVHNQAKRLDAQRALADMLVAVDAAAEPLLRIVEVNRLEAFEP